ncbi:hypothetical protein BH11MYX4_BH11MYX4_08290 [soil metagenome]
MNDEKHDDDNPWDEDDGGRTLATDGPSFEMPSNIPSPITAPPPAPAPAPIAPPPPPPPQAVPLPSAVTPKSAAKATLVGLMPEDFRSRLPKGPPHSAPRPPPSSARRPAAPLPVSLPDDVLDDLPGQQDDGPTMAGAPSTTSRPLRDDAVSPPLPRHGFSQEPPVNDRDAETMALSVDDFRLPVISDDGEPEEATRALTREEMMGRGHQDAHVVVGNDAIGDEATLAIGPDQLNADLGHLGASLDPALAEALAQRVAEHHQQVHQQQVQQQQQHQPPPQQHETYGQAQQHQHQHQQQPWQDPMIGQPSQQAYPPSGQHPVMGGPPPSHPMPWGPNPGAPPSYAQGAPQGMMQGPPPSWTPQQAPVAQPLAAEGLAVGGFRITSQVLVLAGVGVVCLAIFVVGLVLFFTTKF